MTPIVEIHTRELGLGDLQKERIERQVASLEKRLKKFKDPVIDITIRKGSGQEKFHACVLITLGTAGKQLRSDEDGVSPDMAVKEAVRDIKRQLEREVSHLRGEDSYGVPSRRFPSELRPHPPDEAADDESDIQVAEEGAADTSQ